MLEVEIKFVVDDVARLRAALSGWKALGTIAEVDQYFAAPDRDFAVTDEVLRIRTSNGRNSIIYKGPKRDHETKTRPEIEVLLRDGDEPLRAAYLMLSSLRYRPVEQVRKSRETFETHRDGFALHATIDSLDSIGTFAEVEIVAEEKDFDAAKKLVISSAKELGLSQQERRSYLQLVLSQRKTAAPETQRAESVDGLRQILAPVRHRGTTIGLVPTMGALHAGHAALIDQARKECGFVVVSVFVNPTQFGPNEDFSKYPRTLEADVALCREHGVDLVFTPKPDEVYPLDFSTFVEIQGLSDVFEGAIRPGHFRGVATVVLKLFNMVQPNVAYFGQKDAQQARLVQRMVSDLDMPVRLAIVLTVREPDGLALSSRNRYLAPELRKQAVALSQALFAAKSAFEAGERDATALNKLMQDTVARMPDVQLDYAAIVHADTFAPFTHIDGPALALIAARLGGTRLIDNLPLQ
ncbi:MAG: pantoate--beta-alanine ligase [Gemmataceae bacterium]